MASTYQFGDKEYTRQQVIDYGRENYPKPFSTSALRSS